MWLGIKSLAFPRYPCLGRQIRELISMWYELVSPMMHKIYLSVFKFHISKTKHDLERVDLDNRNDAGRATAMARKWKI
jgi:hypothetical protein